MTFNHPGYCTALSMGSAVPDWQSILPSHSSNTSSITSGAQSLPFENASPQDFPDGNYVKQELKTDRQIHGNTSHILITTKSDASEISNQHLYHGFINNQRDGSNNDYGLVFDNMGNGGRGNTISMETGIRDYHSNTSTNSIAHQDNMSMSMDGCHGNTADKVTHDDCLDASISYICGSEKTATLQNPLNDIHGNEGVTSTVATWRDITMGSEGEIARDQGGTDMESSKLQALNMLGAREDEEREGGCLLNMIHRQSLAQLRQHSRTHPTPDTASQTKYRTKRKISSVKLKLKLRAENRDRMCEDIMKSEKECSESKCPMRNGEEIHENTGALMIDIPENETETIVPVKQELVNANQIQPETSDKEKIPCQSVGCGRLFKSASAMGRHMYKEHLRRDTKFVCDIEGCGKAFKARKCLNNHRILHQNERPFLCSICGQRFKTKNYLKNHDVTHETERNFPCDFSGCEKAFKSVVQLKSHQQCHKERLPSERFPCSVGDCDKTYKTKYNLMDHLKIHEAENTNTPFPCASCGNSYRTQRHLNRHKLRSHAEVRKEYTCTYEGCGKTYRDKSYLKVHTKSHSLDYGCFLCNEPCCGKTFRSLDALTRHKRKVHPESRNFVCKTCGKSFKTKTTLQVHEFTHTELRPYKCSFDGCGKGFRTRSNCKTHEFTHTGEKPFKCNICGECFRSNVAVDTHRLEHYGPDLMVANAIEDPNIEAKQDRSQTPSPQ